VSEFSVFQHSDIQKFENYIGSEFLTSWLWGFEHCIGYEFLTHWLWNIQKLRNFTHKTEILARLDLSSLINHACSS
jgi:hypothetical protein